MKRYVFFSVVSISLFVSCATAQTPQPADQSSPEQITGPSRRLTLAEAEALALKNNPQITVARLNTLIAQQDIREARSALLPNAYLSMTAVDSHENSRITAGALNNPVIYPRAATGATVSQLITDFGRTTNLVSRSKSEEKAQSEYEQASREQILLAVDRAFYDALETKALIEVAQQTASARQVLLDKVQALTGAKLRSDLDLSFARVDFSRAQLLILEAKNNYETSVATLSAVLGFPDEQNLELVSVLGAPQPPAPTVNALIQQALQQRPEVQALQSEVTAAQQYGAAEHDLKRPTISALGAVGLAPVRDYHLSNWYGAVGININIPVFNGFLYDARAKAADLQASAEQQRLIDLRNSIARDVRVAWQNSNRSFERLSVTRQLREEAQLALDLAQSRYNLGLSSIVEFSQAELQKTEADIADTDAIYQYEVTQILVNYSIGTPH